MSLRFLSSGILIALGLATPVAAQQFVLLPANYLATDVTPDGSTVVGRVGGGDSFIWRWKIDPAPTVIPGGSAVAVSDDGSVLAGNITDPSVNAEAAAIWTQATGWQSLGWLPNALSCPSKSNAYAISGDGSTVVGLSWDGCSGRGFRWTAGTGMQQLQNLANGNNRCSAISRDGSTLAGFAQGNFNRTPAYWNPGLSGAVLDANYEGEAYGLNNNGSLSVGTIYAPAPFNGAYIRNKQTGAIQTLGSLNAGWVGNATDLSEDAGVIVGFDSLMLAREAWVWTQSDGIKSLNNRLAALGLMNVPPLYTCVACSDTGNVIVGSCQFGLGFGGYIVEAPIASRVSPYGTGTPGCTGPEVLSAFSPPQINNPNFTLVSTNAPPQSLGLWLIGSSPDFAGSDPLAIGAKLHIDLFTSALLIGLNGTSDATGLGLAAAPIPNNPGLIGATVFAQVIWAWPLAVCNNVPFGLSSSNGLAITFQP